MGDITIEDKHPLFARSLDFRDAPGPEVVF